MKLLLHTCCAPCMIYPLERIRKNGYDVTAFFYNPNVHPLSEYNNRKQAVEFYTKDAGAEVIYFEYEPSVFFQAVNRKEKNPGRCRLCWTLRMKATASTAKEKGFDAFSTTLLVSPYQDQELLRNIGNSIAEVERVKFYYEDFRPGFKEAHNKAKIHGLYCQKYCGCIYSEMEKHSKKK